MQDFQENKFELPFFYVCKNHLHFVNVIQKVKFILFALSQPHTSKFQTWIRVQFVDSPLSLV